jgi:hypothetical protein
VAAPFFDNIQGTVTSGPGTGAFTPTAAGGNALAWSTLPANQILNYRADEGSTWETGVGLWNGTTLSRNLDQSSSGSLINFGTGVIITASIPSTEVQPHIGGGHWGLVTASPNVSAFDKLGLVPVDVGTAAASAVASTNYLTRQHRAKRTSLTTANALAGLTFANASVYRSTTAFMGGFEFVARFGCSGLPTGPRLCVGVGAANMAAADPSGLLNMAAFIKDSADTNIQFATNDGTSTATKVDTGIPLVANSFYEMSIWQNPGEAKIYYSLVRLDTGAVKLGSVTADLPVADTAMLPQIQGSLAATIGTAIVMEISSLYLRSSF